MQSGPTSNSSTPNFNTKTRSNSSVPPCAPSGESLPDSQNPKPTQRREATSAPDARTLTPNHAADQQQKINSPSSSLDEVKARAQRVNSNIRNILLTSPTFPRLYADVVLHYAPNSHEAKILRPHYQKICEKVNAMSNSNGTCTHIKVTGVRCGSPALRGEQFCYFHQNAHRGVRRPQQSRLHPIALIEDEESIQYALMEVINALMRNTIDLKRATLILRALHIAVKNASRVKYGIMGKNAVTNIPEYAPPSVATDFDELSQIDLPYNASVPPKTERQIMEEKHRAHKLQEWRDQQAQIRANLERAKPQPSASAGADASPAPRPEPNEVRVPAAQPNPTPKPATSPLPSHDFKPPHRLQSSDPHPTPRKEPKSATPVPKSQRNTAHTAKHG